MITAILEDTPSLKAIIQPKGQVIFAKINPLNSVLKATIESKVEMESYYEVGNESGGYTIIIGD